MDSEIKKSQMIFKYLNDELYGKERYDFETRISLDVSLWEEVEFHKILYQDLNNYEEQSENEFLIKKLIQEAELLPSSTKSKTKPKTNDHLS